MNYDQIALKKAPDMFTYIQDHICNGKKIELSYHKDGEMVIKKKDSLSELMETNRKVLTDCIKIHNELLVFFDFIYR